jgi:hypothetical protein
MVESRITAQTPCNHTNVDQVDLAHHDAPYIQTTGARGTQGFLTGSVSVFYGRS